MSSEQYPVRPYTVGPALPEHIRMLPEIERAAAAMFPADLLTPAMRAASVPLAELAAACAEGRLWVAVTDSGCPVGFALAVPESATAYLQEMDVHPAHQRQGLGRELVGSVINWARAQAFPCVGLTTFEHIAWNAPFYRQLGFRTLAESGLSGELRAHLLEERRLGLRRRVAMQLDLNPGWANNARQPDHTQGDDA